METAIFAAAIFMLLMGRPRLHYGLPTDGSYMSHDRTMMINGFFMVLMVLRHISIFCCPVQPEDEWYYIHVDAPMVQFIVCTYFFYSGYGIMCSLQTKGRLYLRQLLTKRFTGLYIRFGFAAAIACLLTALISQEFAVQTHRFLYTMVGCGGWWFIVMSLVLYLLTWISFSAITFSPEHPHRSLVGIAILIILIGIVVSLMYPYKESWWLDTEWCFPGGMLYCLYRRKLEYVVRKSRIPCFLWGAALIYASVWALHHFHLFAKAFGWLTGISLGELSFVHYSSALACIFALGITWLFASVTWERTPAPLVWLGRNAFYLFLFQYVPMTFFRHVGLNASHPQLCILLAFVSAIALSALMKWIFSCAPTLITAARRQ